MVHEVHIKCSEATRLEVQAHSQLFEADNHACYTSSNII